VTLTPFTDGAVHVTVADESPPVAAPMVGAPGTALLGVTVIDELENGPVPATLMAATVNVYDWPLVRPVTMQFVEGSPVEFGQASVIVVEPCAVTV
jgi:hypothetical protein